MYADQTLTPKEAARLCALGTLAGEEMTYGELAGTIRHFMDRVQGPSLDVMGLSLELLKYEGLAVAVSGEGDDAVLRISDAGSRELEILLTANVRPGATDLNKLIVALKFRFLHLLAPEARSAQVDTLIDVSETEITRLLDLRQSLADDSPFFPLWLDHEIAELTARLEWLKTLDLGDL